MTQIAQMSEEIWKPIESYPGSYEVSNQARVRSIDRIVWRNEHKMTLKGRVLRPSTKGPYPKVSLSAGSKYAVTKTCIHALVARAFIPNPNNLPEVNHVDGDKRNNAIENLEWTTSSGNKLHCCRVLLKRIGANHCNAKLKESDIPKIIDAINGGQKYREVSEAFGVTNGVIYKIVKGVGWRHVSRVA